MADRASSVPTKRFHTYGVTTQWLIAVSGAVILSVLLWGWVRLVDDSAVWSLAIFLVVPAIQFLATPLFTVLGWYTYHSPMVVSFGGSKRVIDLHNGSSFDYLLEMRGVRPGAAWKQTMMRHYLLALLGIIARVEEGELRPDVVVRGSSYFLSERSARRLGFTVSETSFLERLNLLLNVVDLLWTYSLANGQWTVPNLRNTRTVRTTGRNLVAQKSRIEAIVARISRGAPTRG